jgi:hypothetical protein
LPQGKDVKRLIFLHIHRTGGTTLRWELIYKRLDRRNVFCLQGDEPPTRCGSIEELLAMPTKLEAVVGHMPFGLREHLPWPESWRYVAFMREPISRAVSTYYQVRHSAVPQAGEDSLGPLAHDDATRFTLEEYVRNRCMMSWNGMCQFLSNQRFGKKFASDEEMFFEAWRNAGELSFVGLLEDYDESLRWLCRMFDWRMPRACRPHNVLTPKGRTLSDGEFDVLRAANRFDQILYDRFRERFALEGRLRAPVPSLSELTARMARIFHGD